MNPHRGHENDTNPNGSRDCCQTPPSNPASDFPIFAERGNVSCCGHSAAAPAAALEKPGYRLWEFVEDFMETPAGAVPRVRTRLTRQDRMGTIRTRLGTDRYRYGIAPGLYAVGRPDDASAVLVSANYKLSFDTLRSHLTRVDAWILVVDTRGINVWCAAGKGTFCADEVTHRVRAARLERVVSHRRLILPQLAATGVAARTVKKRCGFEVIWGPVHASMKTFRYLPGVSTIEYEEKLCVGCGSCETVCPHGVFAMQGSQARLMDPDGCMECGACARNCPTAAIRVTPGVGCAAYIISGWIHGKENANCGGEGGCC